RVPHFILSHAPPTTELYTLSLHDALPICRHRRPAGRRAGAARERAALPRNRRVGERRGLDARRGRPDQLREPRDGADARLRGPRSEEHTSELQSLAYLVCRLLLEKKKKKR